MIRAFITGVRLTRKHNKNLTFFDAVKIEIDMAKNVLGLKLYTEYMNEIREDDKRPFTAGWQA